MTIIFNVPCSYAAELHVESAACRFVARHEPDADVAYKGGVDVHGQKVAPSDLNPSFSNSIQNTITIKLTNDAAKLFGIKVPEMVIRGADGNTTKQPMVGTETQIGYVTLRGGHALLNGQPLDSAAESQLITLCNQPR